MGFYPIGSMHGIFAYIYHKNQPNVGKYTIHGSYGYGTIRCQTLSLVQGIKVNKASAAGGVQKMQPSRGHMAVQWTLDPVNIQEMMGFWDKVGGGREIPNCLIWFPMVSLRKGEDSWTLGPDLLFPEAVFSNT